MLRELPYICPIVPNISWPSLVRKKHVLLVGNADMDVACAFYHLTPILLPYNLPHPKVYELLHATSADGLISAAGNLPLDDLAKQSTNLHLLTWVVEKTSRHMDWNGAPSSNLKVSVWHDVVEENTSSAPQLPANDDLVTPAGLVVVWQNLRKLSEQPTITTLTSRNLVSAISALITALPSRQRLTPSDLVLPASSFCMPYVLCQTFAALFIHASLAINSVAEPGVDLGLAMRGIAPTVVIASAETMAKEHSTTSPLLNSIHKYTSSQSLASGRMPDPSSILARLLAPSPRSTAPGKLRLILVSHRIGAGSPTLTGSMLSDLRISTRARICYALTSPFVAGAVAQTHVFDYRVANAEGEGHFGLPLSSVELKLVSDNDAHVDGSTPEGEIVAKGPAVADEPGKEVRLGVRGKFGSDGTLSLTSLR